MPNVSVTATYRQGTLSLSGSILTVSLPYCHLGISGGWANSSKKIPCNLYYIG